MAGIKSATPRVAFGSVAPTVVRVRRTERALAESVGLDAAIAILETELAPIDDLRSSADYRREVAGRLLRRFWNS